MFSLSSRTQHVLTICSTVIGSLQFSNLYPRKCFLPLLYFIVQFVQYVIFLDTRGNKPLCPFIRLFPLDTINKCDSYTFQFSNWPFQGRVDGKPANIKKSLLSAMSKYRAMNWIKLLSQLF